jgi:hypothetical protein
MERFNTLEDLRNAIARIERTQHRTRRSWTIAQIYFHLAAALEASVDGLPPGYSQIVRFVVRPFRSFVTRVRFPPCLPIPKAIAFKLSPPQDADQSEQYQRLVNAIDRFSNFEGTLSPHPVLGPLNRDEWIGFHLRHAQHHLSFIEPTKSDSH